MNNRLTVLVLSMDGDPARQFSVSKAFLAFLACFATACTGILSIGMMDYRSLRFAVPENETMKIEHQVLTEQVRSQDKIILAQRQQLKMIASEVNDVRDKLVALNLLEQKVWDLASKKGGIKKIKANSGVGGSSPDDLDAGLELKKDFQSVKEVHKQVEQLSEASDTQKKRLASLINELEKNNKLAACTPSTCPIRGRVTSLFGHRKSPFSSRVEFHDGLDIAAPWGTPVKAPADGVVTFASRQNGFGRLITISHGNGLVTRYAHLSKFLKKVGDKVKRGDKIGLVGSTGRSSGPHLHYEVRVNGKAVDPQQYIPNYFSKKK